MRRVPKMLPALVPILALVACQDPDVGNPCTLTWGAPPAPTATTVGSDFFESGSFDKCEGGVCVVSPASGTKYADATQYASGYCSKPCVSNADCFESETGLVCRQMVLDQAFLEELGRRDPATRDRYLADIKFSSYCAVPR